MSCRSHGDCKGSGEDGLVHSSLNAGAFAVKIWGLVVMGMENTNEKRRKLGAGVVMVLQNCDC